MSEPVLKTIEVEKHHIRPSWKRYGSGSARLELTAHKTAGWLTLHITEQAEKSSKTTTITLDSLDLNSLKSMIDFAQGV